MLMPDNWNQYVTRSSLEQAVKYFQAMREREIVTEQKLTALAGNARSITGVTPRYSAMIPSSLNSCLATSRIPLGYVP